MRAETIHVTDHALLRWKERVSEDVNRNEIVQAVKNSRVIKRKEHLPYRMPRIDGSVYSLNNELLFILESVTIDEYRLITVITKSLYIAELVSEEYKASVISTRSRLIERN